MKPKIGDILYLEFYDHCQSQGQCAEMKVFTVGKLIKEDKRHYWTTSWAGLDEVDHNAEIFCTVKSAVIKRRTLR